MSNREKKVGFVKVIRMVHECERWFLPVVLLQQLIASCLPFVTIILGAMVIDGISAGRDERELTGLALALLWIYMVLSLIRWALDKVLIVLRRRLEDILEVRLVNKSMTMDYQVLERAESLDHITKAQEGARSSGGISTYCILIGTMLSCVIKIVYAAVIMGGFFFASGSSDGSHLMRFVNSWWCPVSMLLAIMATVCYNALLQQKCNQMEYSFFERNVRANRKFSYFSRFYADYRPGKPVRIYDMKDYIVGQMADLCGFLKRENVILNRKQELCHGQMRLITAIFMLVSYLFVGLKATAGVISLGQMAMYVSALTVFAEALGELCQVFTACWTRNKYLSHYVKFLEIKNEKYDGTIPIEKRLDSDYELEFRDVSFHYPNNRENVLEHVTAKIHVGKKMAVVGRNGAGKSTFIKLLCRLYDPTEGEILLNGIDIRKYDYDEYRDIFGVVFQDFQLFSFSIAQNVAAGVEYDEEKVWRCLEQAGLKKRVAAMRDGLDTVIYKLGDEGVEISGGEAQKLAIARALYKDAPVVILDEPTAALDPASELEIYERFDAMVEEKTAIYISHRMSSCRFCENILVFDKGKIIQMGSHENLLREEGIYRELWEAQSQYYL